MTIYERKMYTTKSNLKKSQRFESVIIVCIFLSSITLIIDTPLLDQDSLLAQVLYYADIVFTVLFTIEAFIKIFALGFFYNSLPGVGGYITNGWNILDFIVVLASLFDLVTMLFFT